jgi:dolichyl-phosphate beta-glucosyltransferase
VRLRAERPRDYGSRLFRSHTMPSSPYLSVVLPAYNEVASIRRTLGLTHDYLSSQGYPFEIIVAADGEDGTREAASELGRERGHVKVLGSPGRHGKGRGVRQGMAAATGEIVGFVDADNKTPIEELSKILPAFDEGFDLVIGSRASVDSSVERSQPGYRQIGSKVFAAAMHVTTGLWEIRDTQCGFKFFRAPVARDLFSRQQVDGYMFDVEILSLAVGSGYRIKEVGIRWSDDGDSRLALVSGNWRNMMDLVKIGFRARISSKARAPRAVTSRRGS